MKSHIIQDAKIFKEVVFITILSKNFKYAYHLVVSIIDKLVEEWDGLEMDHTKHTILSKNLMLELHDAINIFIIFLISISIEHLLF